MTHARIAPQSGRLPPARRGGSGMTRIGRALLTAVVVTLGQLAPAVVAGGPSGQAPIAPAGPSVGHGATPTVTATAATDTPGAASPEATGGIQPGIQYEEAIAHAGDRIAFAAGGIVTVPFRPRLGDAWPVAGRAPRALPAGSASGRALRVRPPQGVPTDGAPAAAATPATSPDSAVPPAMSDPAAATPLAADLASFVAPAPAAPLALDGTRLRRQVFGFLPYWEVASATLDDETLSTIAYFSVGADRNGNLLKFNSDGTPTTGWGGWTSSRLTSIINTAHSHGTRVVLTITMFAWTSGQATAQGAFLGNATARLNLARQAAAAVRARGADGINLDFEPIASGYADEFTAFVRTVRSELDRQASGYQLTFDTTGSIGNYPIEAATAAGGADAIFIMGYDYRTSGSSYTGSIDPLAGPAYDLADTIAAYAARVPASRLILGVPWYGRAWSTVSNAVNAKSQSGTKYGASAAVNYATATDYAAQYGRNWDSRELSAWVAYQRQNCTSTYGCVTSWREIYYDDVTAIKARYDLVNRTGLRGVGIWALGYDGGLPDMRQAIGEKFLNDTTVPLAGVNTLPAATTSETIAVSWMGVDESGVRNYDVQVSIDGGPWLSWLVGTTAGHAAYLGADGHGFAFRVRARDTHGNLGAWGVTSVYHTKPLLAVGGFGVVVASSVNIRSAAGTSAPLVTTAVAGTIVAVTGGPVSADGWTWWKVSLPITQWAPVGTIRTDVWVASGNGSTTLVAAASAPNASAVNLPSGVAPAAGARFVGITPTRLLDTRVGTGLAGPFGTGAPRTFAVAGRAGIPLNAVSVSATVTVVGQTSAGYLSLGPAAPTVNRTSIINLPRGDIRSTGVTVKLGAGGTVAAMWTGGAGSTAQVVLDATGYYIPGTSGATYIPLTAARVLDTRSGNGLAGPFLATVPRSFPVTGHGGVPSGAVAVTGNLTVVGATTAGYAFLGPVATAKPTSASINVRKGDPRAASVTVKLDGSGRLGAVWMGPAGSKANLVLDVTGYFANSGAGATYHPIDGARVLDTRSATGLSGAFSRNVARSFQATGLGTVPIDAVAVTGSVVVVAPTAAGYLVFGATTATLAGTSVINLPRGDIRANGLTVRVASTGGLATKFVAASGSANVVLDLTGWFR